ncbi:hypothetical protein RS1P1_00040 [Pseudomonas moraviensis]|nr:hypothetical protein RS1P1_00040 [Pseudomonas moraviensis]
MPGLTDKTPFFGSIVQPKTRWRRRLYQKAISDPRRNAALAANLRVSPVFASIRVGVSLLAKAASEEVKPGWVNPDM